MVGGLLGALEAMSGVSLGRLESDECVSAVV